MTPDDDKALARAAVFRRTAEDPTWMGFWLERHREGEQVSRERLAESLGLSLDGLSLLSLCRAPRPEEFREALGAICRRTGADELALARLLRQQQALRSWEQAPPSTEGRGWLMAASDHVETPHDGGETPGGDG